MNSSNSDETWTWIAGIIGLASFLPTAQQALIDVHVLTSTRVLIPIGEGAGLDLPRVVIAAGALVLAVLLVVLTVRSRQRRVEQGGRA